MESLFHPIHSLNLKKTENQMIVPRYLSNLQNQRESKRFFGINHKEKKFIKFTKAKNFCKFKRYFIKIDHSFGNIRDFSSNITEMPVKLTK